MAGGILLMDSFLMRERNVDRQAIKALDRLAYMGITELCPLSIEFPKRKYARLMPDRRQPRSEAPRTPDTLVMAFNGLGVSCPICAPRSRALGNMYEYS